MKKNLHPKWHNNVKVYCDEKEIMITNSTIPVIRVEIWSGNHPFFTGSLKYVDSEGRIERFEQQYFTPNAYNSAINS
jgi:large subunit ribosomal protein L31